MYFILSWIAGITSGRHSNFTEDLPRQIWVLRASGSGKELGNWFSQFAGALLLWVTLKVIGVFPDAPPPVSVDLLIFLSPWGQRKLGHSPAACDPSSHGTGRLHTVTISLGLWVSRTSPRAAMAENG